jgi:hypothetical protein
MFDLYTADLNSLKGQDLFAAVESLLRMSEPIADRLPEGWTLDFKEQWADEMLRHVVAFANTFGGLLILGVSEESGKPKDIVGIQTKSELKTRIASSIAANVSPTPSFAIAEGGHPHQPGRCLVVIRIKNVNKLHYYMKGDKPIYVRNEDESRPANAAQLRSLVEQRTSDLGTVDDGTSLTKFLSEFLCDYWAAGCRKREKGEPYALFNLLLAPGSSYGESYISLRCRRGGTV